MTKPPAFDSLVAVFPIGGCDLLFGETVDRDPVFAVLRDEVDVGAPLIMAGRERGGMVRLGDALVVQGTQNDSGMILRLDPLTASPGMGAEPLDAATPVAIGEHALLVCGGHAWSEAVAASTARTSLWSAGGRVDAAPLPGPRAYAAGVSLPTGALLCGGMPAGLEVDVYSAARGTWSRTEPRWSPPPTPPDFRRVHEILARYAALDGVPWQAPSRPPALSWTAPVVLPDGSVVLLMFATDGEAVVSTDRIARFDPTTERWSALIEVPGTTGSIACGAHGLVALGDGRLAVLADHGRLLVWDGLDRWTDGPALGDVRAIHGTSGGNVLADLGDAWMVLRC